MARSSVAKAFPAAWGVAFGLLASLTLAQGAQAQVVLAWKFAPGQVFDVEMTQRTETDTQFAERPLKLVAETTLSQQWTVESVDDQGTARISQEFRRLAVKLELPQGASVSYDSASAKKPSREAQEIAASLGPLIGGKLRVAMNARGEISEVELSDDLLEKIGRISADSNWKERFSAEGLRQWLRQTLVVFPAEELRAGATWSRPLEFDSPLGRVQLETDYRYAGPQSREGKPLERIELSGRIKLGRGKSTQVEPPTIKSQEQTGVLWFDATGGRLVEVDSTQRMKTEGRVRDSSVTVTSASTLKTRVVAR